MSALEDTLALQIEAEGLPPPERQCKEPWAGTGRRFRGDLCWTDRRVVLEVDGGTWSGGRHVTGSGYARDCTKQNMAHLAGWTVYRVEGGMVRDGTALDLVEAIMERHPPCGPA